MGCSPIDIFFLSWVGMSTSGHTKHVTVNAVVLIAYCVGMQPDLSRGKQNTSQGTTTPSPSSVLALPLPPLHVSRFPEQGEGPEGRGGNGWKGQV